MVVLCAANNWDDVKLADRHMAERLAKHVPILYVDPPLSRLTPLHHPHLRPSTRRPRLRLVNPNIARLTPLIPPRGSLKGLARLSELLLRRQLSNAVKCLGGKVQAVISASPAWPVFDTCGERFKMFWVQDDYSGGAQLMGVDESRLRQAELETASEADVIVAASPALAALWRDRGYRPIMIPNGCDARGYRERAAETGSRERPDDVYLAPPIAGAVGQLNDRTDVRLLEAVADRGLSVLVVGPLAPSADPSRTAALFDRPNVQWVGAKSFDELWQYYQLMDVGLVPYTLSDFNLRSFPLKTLEYLAAEIPVVSTDLPASRWLGTDLVTIASTPDEFAEATLQSAARRRDPADIRRRVKLALDHDWSRRAEDFARILEVSPQPGWKPALQPS
jgi:glycosyltransferase involved in cell wall biosynthesis